MERAIIVLRPHAGSWEGLVVSQTQQHIFGFLCSELVRHNWGVGSHAEHKWSGLRCCYHLMPTETSVPLEALGHQQICMHGILSAQWCQQTWSFA